MNFQRQKNNLRHWIRRASLVAGTSGTATQVTLESQRQGLLQVLQAHLSIQTTMFNPSSAQQQLQLPASLAQEATPEYKYLRLNKTRGWGWIFQLDRATTFEEHKWLTTQRWNYCFNFRWYKLDAVVMKR